MKKETSITRKRGRPPKPKTSSLGDALDFAEDVFSNDGLEDYSDILENCDGISSLFED